MTNIDVEKRIVFLAIEPILELDLVGTLSIFQTANYLLRPQKPFYQVEVITSGKGSSVIGDCGLSINVNKKLEALVKESISLNPIDTLLVIGGSGSLKIEPIDTVALWIKKESSKIRRVGSICTGAFVLAAAGLLDNLRATTHWSYCANLLAKHPKIQVDNNSIFVKDRNIYTSAGVTAGMDLALELVEEDLGSTMALDISRLLVIFLRRPGGQSQFSVTLNTLTPERHSLKILPAWILEHISEPLPIEVLANQSAMSLRHFARVFTSEFGTTPAQYVLEQRVEAARRSLIKTKLGQKEIALKCGFSNVEHMRRAFLRITGVTPNTYRKHFNQN
ncbi:MAG: GlxA family transcriptional regulator [Acidobacteria bacterium]|nr:GlxA family transcriptional regulator [Acidobacteriota bacterium]